MKYFAILWNLWLQKRYDNKFFHPSLLLLFLDPGSKIQDPGWVKSGSGSRIWDKHPGSATLSTAHPFLRTFNLQRNLFWGISIYSTAFSEDLQSVQPLLQLCQNPSLTVWISVNQLLLTPHAASRKNPHA